MSQHTWCILSLSNITRTHINPGVPENRNLLFKKLKFVLRSERTSINNLYSYICAPPSCPPHLQHKASSYILRPSWIRQQKRIPRQRSPSLYILPFPGLRISHENLRLALCRLFRFMLIAAHSRWSWIVPCRDERLALKEDWGHFSPRLSSLSRSSESKVVLFDFSRLSDFLWSRRFDMCLTICIRCPKLVMPSSFLSTSLSPSDSSLLERQWAYLIGNVGVDNYTSLP